MPECVCAHHSDKKFTVNGILRTDPARIGGIQRRFIRDFERRYRQIWDEIKHALVDIDVFGLLERSRSLRFANLSMQTNLEPRQYEFLSSEAKINEFVKWLDEMVKKNILTVERRSYGKIGDKIWSDLYIGSAYQNAIARARRELKKKGYDIPSGGGVLDLAGGASLAFAFNQPFHADRVAIAYTRAFNQMRGLTDEMRTQLSRIIAQGIADGLNPHRIAGQIKVRLGMSLKRARMIARTEISNAHHQATVNEYEQFGVEGVEVVAEWLTAGFGVCPVCMQLSRGGDIAPGIYSLVAIRGMIPVHPNCRCTLMPVTINRQS